MLIKRLSLLVLLVLVTNMTPAFAQSATPDALPYQWVQVVDGLDSPIYITNAGDGSGRLFVLEQGGPIFILKDGKLLDKPFLDMTDLVPDDVIRGGYTERGLLGLVFSPDYAKSGRFYIYYINRD